MKHWLTEPDKPWPISALPDPLARVGRHVMWVCVLGVILSHGDWTRTHEGSCPPLCKPYPIVAPANPQGYSEAAAAWKLMFGTYKPRKPSDEWIAQPKLIPLAFGGNPYE